MQKSLKNRGRRKLSSKAQRLVKMLTTADSVAAAGREAGYSTRQATHRALKWIRETAPEILERIGYGPEMALRNLVQMAHAKETRLAQANGVFTDRQEIPAVDIQLKARVELVRISQCYPKEAVNRGDRDMAEQPRIVINLGFLEPGRAEAILEKLARHRASRGAVGIAAEGPALAATQ